MASDYRAADGHDVALGSLTVLDPQPSADLIQATRRTHGGDGSVYDEGKYIIWRWNVVANETEYQSILSDLGVQSALTNDVTVYSRSEDGSYVRYNGTAIRPQPGPDVRQQNFFLRNVEVVIRDVSIA